MKAQQILLQLFSQLPKYTNFFSTDIAIQSLVRSGLVVTATTAIPHGLLTGQTLNVSGAIIQNPVISLVRVGDVAFVETEFDHDLTEDFNFNVTISGANQIEYNGLKEVLSVPNRREFTYAIEGEPATPATGSILVMENQRTVNPYTGIKIITSVPTPTTFTYAISTPVFSPPSGTIIGSTALRIGGAVNFDKANEWYSRQATGAYWLFVVLGDRTASKDRYALDDATATTPKGTRYRQRIVTPFTCYAFAPLRDDTSQEGVSGRATRDSMEDVFFALCKSILRKKFQTDFSETSWSEVMFTNHGFFAYNQAYYIHQFTFETTFDITFDDTIVPDDNVAFRDLEVDFQRLTDDYIISTMAINLDDDPI